MRARLMSALFLVSAALAGCGGEASGPVDTSKLQRPTAEEAEAIAEQDRKIHDEEFGKPMPGSKTPKVLQKK